MRTHALILVLFGAFSASDAVNFTLAPNTNRTLQLVANTPESNGTTMRLTRASTTLSMSVNQVDFTNFDPISWCGRAAGYDHFVPLDAFTLIKTPKTNTSLAVYLKNTERRYRRSTRYLYECLNGAWYNVSDVCAVQEAPPMSLLAWIAAESRVIDAHSLVAPVCVTSTPTNDIISFFLMEDDLEPRECDAGWHGCECKSESPTRSTTANTMIWGGALFFVVLYGIYVLCTMWLSRLDNKGILNLLYGSLDVPYVGPCGCLKALLCCCKTSIFLCKNTMGPNAPSQEEKQEKQKEHKRYSGSVIFNMWSVFLYAPVIACIGLLIFTDAITDYSLDDGQGVYTGALSSGTAKTAERDMKRDVWTWFGIVTIYVVGVSWSLADPNRHIGGGNNGRCNWCNAPPLSLCFGRPENKETLCGKDETVSDTVRLYRSFMLRFIVTTLLIEGYLVTVSTTYSRSVMDLCNMLVGFTWLISILIVLRWPCLCCSRDGPCCKCCYCCPSWFGYNLAYTDEQISARCSNQQKSCERDEYFNNRPKYLPALNVAIFASPVFVVPIIIAMRVRCE